MLALQSLHLCSKTAPLIMMYWVNLSSIKLKTVPMRLFLAEQPVSPLHWITKRHCDVLSYTIKKVNGRVPVVAGTGSNDTRYAVELSRHAQEAGADALLMVTPYYNKTSQTGLINHYHYVADRVDVPIILYNVPSRTGCNIQPTTYVELAKHPNIVATKEASGDISSIAKTISLCGDDLAVYSGNDDQVIPILSLGGKGVISVFSNIYPQKMHQICAEFFNGNTEKSRDMMLHYLDLMNGLFCDVNPIPVKEAMNMMGYLVRPLPDAAGANERVCKGLFGCTVEKAWFNLTSKLDFKQQGVHHEANYFKRLWRVHGSCDYRLCCRAAGLRNCCRHLISAPI